MGKEKNSLSCGNLVKDSIDFEFYKTVFDPVRSEILVYLVSHGKKNIKEIAENFSQDRSVISRHLDLMYRFSIVLKTKENRNIYYEANSMFIVEKFEQTTENLKKLMLLQTPIN
jgi:DNA-binding transcriptional ArsR family regulator